MTIQVRQAHLRDIPFVRDLAVKMVVHGIPHTRDVDPQVVQARTRQGLAQLELALRLEKDFKILIAEDVDKSENVGYIMLDFREEESSTGEPQCMIHDLAVRRDYWGRYVVNHLIRAAADLTAERGLKYLVGEVTTANERTLGTALKGLGFEIERHQIVKKVSPRWTEDRQQSTGEAPR